MDSGNYRSEIVFFDVETTVPTRSGQRFAILEFGSILVCPRKLVELESYSTLVRPSDLSLLSSLSVRCNGITRDAVISAPTFTDIGPRVYDLLHGRIWAGHNILRFDCARIREAFADIGLPAPEPKGTIDSLALLTQKFGRRAGDMKMASLASYFGLGRQIHRSLDDVRMNLEVLKYCATVLFLESSLPDIFTENSWVSPNATTRSRSNEKLSPKGTRLKVNSPTGSLKLETCAALSPTNRRTEENSMLSSPTSSGTGEGVQNLAETNTSSLDPFDMGILGNEITMVEIPVADSSGMSSTIAISVDCNADFLEPDKISIPSISAFLVPFYHGSQKIKIVHKDCVLQLFCAHLKVRFGINMKFLDHSGRPQLKFGVEACPNLCRILDACDDIAQKMSVDSGSTSEWRRTVMRKNGFFNSPTVRLVIPTVVNQDTATYSTEILQKESSGCLQKLVFSRFDAAELNSFLVPGTFIDAYLTLDPYDYQQNAGIRLVAKKLVINST
ncbi:protein NEN1-like [Malania oleifera]|uniref:protein NEN1-like n=1 Tax=Malania oleifera TaxID=397392 RepID=UPI0025AE3FF7|nr:protein NEN1-like [Malania oleifera]